MLRLDLARELLEHQVLILHLGAELGRLEQALAVPHAGRQIAACVVGTRGDVDGQPLVEERQRRLRRRHRMTVLGVLDQAVVLGVEDVVDGGQADVLVDAAVAGDEVRVEQLVVVGAGRGRRIDARPIVGIAVGAARRLASNGAGGCAMSARKAWPVRTASTASGLTGAAGLPSTSDVVRRVGNAVGARYRRSLRRSRSAPGMKLP